MNILLPAVYSFVISDHVFHTYHHHPHIFPSWFIVCTRSSFTDQCTLKTNTGSVWIIVTYKQV
jgi:hypothetical protein